jgi:HK97 gp10 family phage protein
MGQTISSKKAGRLQYEVVAPTRYAAYVEFGTKKKTNVPPGFEQYARQFQGKATGDFNDLLLAIAKWVKVKGIAGVAVKRFKSGKRKGLTGFAGRKAQERLDLDLAWTIAYSIAKNGINPQPFMYPALQKNRGKIIQELTRVVTKKR